MHAIDGMACAKRGCDNRGKLGLNIVGHGSFPTKWGRRWRYRCTVCGGTVSTHTGTAYSGRRCARRAFDQVASLRVEGVSMSATARVTGHSRNTLARWLERASTAAKRFNQRMLRDFEIIELPAEELCPFIGTKSRAPWLCAAIAVCSRLWAGSVLGRRASRNATAVLNDVILRGRVVGFPLIATDGFEYYVGVIERLFGSACVDGQVLKTRRNDRVVRVERRRRIGTAAEQRFGSDFERDVFRLITQRGYHVRTQVAVGDPANHRFRIDLVVEGMQGRLAVECDGDEWHGIERYEHDMARQRDLERAGWQFSRIRGGDFYCDQARAMQPVWKELDRLGIKPGGIDEAAADPPAPANRVSLEDRETTAMEPEANEPPATRGESEFALSPPVPVPRTPRLHLTDTPDEVRADAPETPRTTRFSDLPPRPLPELPPAPDIQPEVTHYVSFDGDAGPDPRLGKRSPGGGRAHDQKFCTRDNPG